MSLRASFLFAVQAFHPLCFHIYEKDSKTTASHNNNSNKNNNNKPHKFLVFTIQNKNTSK